jgi:hypothetical protein
VKLLNVGSLVVGLVALVISAVLWSRQPPPAAPQPVPAPIPAPVAAKGGNPHTAEDLGLSIIALEMDAGGHNCVLSTKTPTSHGNKGKDAHWLVINNCTIAVTMAFSNFQLGTTSSNPFATSTSFSLSSGVNLIKAHVDPKADKGDYTFDLLVNAVVQADPDIVIDN